MNTKNDNVQEMQNQQDDAITETKKAVSKSVKKTTKTSTEKKSIAKKEGTPKSTSAKAKTTKPVKDTSKKTSKSATAKKKMDKKEDVGAKKTANTTKKKLSSEDTTEPSNVIKTVKKEDDITTSQEIMSDEGATEIKPIVEDIKRLKLFFVSDMDEEATYLHEMSLQGYHFITKKGMQYFFKQGEATNYFYHLGYHEKDKLDGTRYLDNYAEAGWENIYHEKAEFDGVWNYFRIEMPSGVEEPNIFSDRTSRLALYKRLLSGWRSLLALVVICFLCMMFVLFFLSNHPGKFTGTVMTLCGMLSVIIVLIFVIYIRAYLKISKKQSQLQNI